MAAIVPESREATGLLGGDLEWRSHSEAALLKGGFPPLGGLQIRSSQAKWMLRLPIKTAHPLSTVVLLQQSRLELDSLRLVISAALLARLLHTDLKRSGMSGVCWRTPS